MRARAVFACVVTLSVAVGLWWLRRTWVLVTVEGPSMEPTLHDGDRLAVRRGRRTAVSAGDVVVIERPMSGVLSPVSAEHRYVIKRVGAVAGEPVPPGIPVPDRVVPPGKLVLLGDNSAASFDSRAVGYFATSDLLGSVVRRVRA
ncbi:S26 family signal peptidase [Pseudonocardia sp. CA-107938]|uniref:S26 family signal peptidase n=1 Tax=Pseudonocardia sp. CA-107938 TaxID=3240021 RepID=UPI003D8F9528